MPRFPARISARFAGADETFTIEALMQNGWALQSGTSHFLGQNFARAFDVYFQTQEESEWYHLTFPGLDRYCYAFSDGVGLGRIDEAIPRIMRSA